MSNMDASTGITAGKPKSKTKGNKKAEKERDPKGKSTKPKGKEAVLNYAKFDGQGLSYKCKLFGYAEVSGPRGDRTCVEAIQKLKQQAKQLKKGANEHKLKIIFNITLQGVKVINEKTQTVAHEHQIHKISFISHDPDDRHIFGYIYSPPRRTAEGRKYYLFAIKAEKSADAITSQLYELFQVVYKMQENKKARSNNTSPNKKQFEKSSLPLEPLQDKMLLEMSSRLGGEQHHQIEEHLYAEPIFLKSSLPVSPKAHYAIPSGQPVPAGNESESKECENSHEKNSNGEVESEMLSSEFASSPFTQDSCSPNTTEENQAICNKEANVNMQSPPLAQVVPKIVSTPSINEDSGFEPGFDSATSSISTEPKVDDSFQFQAEFPPFQNGFSISKADLKDTNHSAATDVFGASKDSSSSTDQFQPVVFKNGTQFENTFDINKDIERKARESSRVDVEGTKVSTSSSKSNDEPHFENAKEEEVSSESKSTFSSDDVQPEFNQNVGTLSNLECNIPTDVEKSNNAQEDETSETKTENKNVSFVSTELFEAKFDTGINEISTISETSDKNPFSSFSSNPEAFPNEDPFSSPSAVEEDMSSFGVFPDDDPFSPQGGTNRETVSDPFAESDDIFSSDFTCTPKNNDGEFSKDTENVIFPQTNHETEIITVESNNDDDDIFEAMFEAKIEKGMEEELSKDENEAIAVPSMAPRENNIKIIEQPSAASENTESNGDETTSGNDSQNDKVEDVSKTVTVDIQVRGEQESEMNTFDLTTNDDYVTLKKAAPNENRSLSPSELSPPPLPPRPTLPVNIGRSDYDEIPPDYDEIPPDHVVIPKEPPALPPRPSNQSLNTEHVIRKPPELPPRVDLEEINSDSFSDSVEDRITESAQNGAASPLFQSNFDSFDFNNAENSTETIVELQGSTTVEFDIGDPFKDPFVGADPFQTPISADPFASSPSLDQSYKQGSDGFDPFSDDPFAATPSFDNQSSFNLPNSPFPAQLSFEDPKEDQNSEKQFADFSAAFS